MKAQFFIISSVIIIYITVLSFQYLTGFSDIRITRVEEQQDFSYIEKIKDSFVQAFNISNYTNNGDLSMIAEDMNFNKKFSNQELLKRGISFDSKFIFFSNGFETGDLSKWTSVYGTPQTDSGTKYDGNYSLYSYGLESVSKKLDGVGEVYARVYVNFSTLPSDPYRHYFIGFYDHGNQILGLGVWNDENTYKLRVYSLIGAGSYWASPIYISQDDWHYFELYWYENGTNSRVKGWYDGNLKIDQITDSQGNGKAVDEYKFGGVDIGGGSTNPDLFIDCAAISADYIGGDCYSDAEPYFAFSLKTNEIYTKTGFPCQEEMSPLFDGVLWLKFNEGSGTTAFDSSSYHNDGIFNGETFNDGTSYSDSTPTDLHTTSGFYGKALQFDGSSNHVDIYNLPVNTGNGANTTVTFWMYWNGGDNQMPIGWDTYDLWLANGCFGFNTGESNVLGIPSSGLANTWVHVAAIFYNGNVNNNTVSLYINGIKQDIYNCTGSTTGSQSVTQSFKISGWTNGGGYWFGGLIDEVRIYNRTLSQVEINTEMSSSMPASISVASWSFEEPASATYVNDTHIWVNGIYGSALSFDGANDYVRAPSSDSLNVSNITITAWIYPRSYGGNNMSRIANKNGAYLFYLYNASNEETLSFYYFNAGGISNQSWAAYHSIVMNKWQFVAVAYNGTHSTFYVNGIFNGTASHNLALGPIMKNTNSLYIGNSQGLDRQFNGTIDELRIWNRALSQPEIQAEMYKG